MDTKFRHLPALAFDNGQINFFSITPINLIQFLRQFGELPASLESDLENILQIKEFPKKHQLLRQGQVCHYLYFMERGLARTFIISEDKELTTDIILDGEMLTVFSSFTAQQPSSENIELLENSRLFALHYDDLQRLYREYNGLERIGRLIAEHFYQSIMAKNYRLKFNSASERYEQLLRDKPEVIKRVPIGIIASYLGMSIETLSRIRSRID